MTTSDCRRCTRPTRDGAYTCDHCGDELSRALGDVPALDVELETTITQQQGIDYRRVGGSGGRIAPRGDVRIDGDRTLDAPSQDDPALGAHIQNDPGNMAAADARSNLRALLVRWVLFCHNEGIRNQSPHDGLPADTIPAMASWLLWRVDGLAWHDLGSDAVDEVTSAVAHCARLIDRPADRQYLGQCQGCGEGDLWGRPGGERARCDNCGASLGADELRRVLLAELDERLYTAAEIAHLSTYLGFKAGRDVIRKRINLWASRGLIEKHPAITNEATFRFGEVYERLVASEYAKNGVA